MLNQTRTEKQMRAAALRQHLFFLALCVNCSAGLSFVGGVHWDEYHFCMQKEICLIFVYVLDKTDPVVKLVTIVPHMYSYLWHIDNRRTCLRDFCWTNLIVSISYLFVRFISLLCAFGYIGELLFKPILGSHLEDPLVHMLIRKKHRKGSDFGPVASMTSLEKGVLFQ